MREAPFFIVGIGRSGTTMLRLMFHNHRNIAIPYESHFITNYHTDAEKYGSLDIDANVYNLIDDLLTEDSIEQWDYKFKGEEIFNQINSRTIGGVIDAIYTVYCRAKGKSRWGDKSDYLDRMDLINNLFPDAKFIHIVRDGRDVASSVLKLPWGPTDIIQAAEWWKYHLILGRKMGNILGPDRYIEVSYEKLVQDTENQLQRLCAFLGEDFDSSMLTYHEQSKNAIPKEHAKLHHNTDKAPQLSRVFAWKREMSPGDNDIFCSYAHEALNLHGYEIGDFESRKLSLIAGKFYVLFKRVLRKLI